MPKGVGPPILRRAREAVARPIQAVKRYVDESLDTLRPMDNPPGYEDEEDRRKARGDDAPRKWRSIMEHGALWRRAFQRWRESFDYDQFMRDGGLGRGLKRPGTAGEEEGGDPFMQQLSPETRAFFAQKEEVERRIKELQAKLKTDLTPEELERHRKELMAELQEGQGALKNFAEDRVELMRLTVREFVEGYREGRDHSSEEVQAAIDKQVKAFKSMLLEGDWTPEAIEANKRRNLRALKEAMDRALAMSADEKAAAEREVQELMRRFDESVDSEEVRAAQRKVEQVIQRVTQGVAGAVKGAVKGAVEGSKEGGGGSKS